jgi:hypothetical protein
VSYLINSRNFSLPDEQPHLSLNASAVPEPGVAILAAAGLPMLWRRRGRKRAS